MVLLAGAPLLAQNRKASAQTSVNRSANVNSNKNYNANVNKNYNANVNKNVNVNTNQNVNVNVNKNVNVNSGSYYGRSCCYHSNTAAVVATTAIVTAAVVGSRVNTLPPACSVVMVNGLTYQKCGSTWYQPQFVGTSTTYVVVVAPR
jgi:hypothetical protein